MYHLACSAVDCQLRFLAHPRTLPGKINLPCTCGYTGYVLAVYILLDLLDFVGALCSQNVYIV